MNIEDFLKFNNLSLSKDKIASSLQGNKIGILITNLGSPAKPTYWALYKYLAKFLGDPRVVKLNRFLWLPVLYGYVLPFRSGKSLSKYKNVWTEEGSPLCVNTHNQCAALKERLFAKYNDKVAITYGMRYGERSIKRALSYLKGKNINKLLVVPLYPQSAECTVASTLDCIGENLKNWNNIPELRFLSGYCLNEKYLNSMTECIQNFWKKNGRGNKLIISYHSIPTKTVEDGDLYPFFCIESTNQLIKKLNLRKEDYLLAFQSRIEGQKWIQPCIENILKQLSSDGCDVVDVVCPSFSADCLETLEEIEITYRQQFLQYGNGRLRYISCLNYSKVGIDFLMGIIEENMVGW
ncbi:ferrochelatase [Plasmodium vivax Brazil I]|uniref:Ferrochelatase n=2 Tax=Plasmodium vivax TaxID=5855 RepID=A0A564ZZ12_PLAVI|nr:ferrochelatase [Plasmodium vivax Brazil I]VUZ96814.1 ferrochelatase, putative [Plasmodium vivax]